MENFLNNLELPHLFCIFAVLIMQFTKENYLFVWLKRTLFALIVLSFCRILFISYLFPYFNGAPISQIPKVLFWGVLFDVQAMVYFLLPFHLLSLIPFKLELKYRQLSMRILFTLGLSLIVLLNLIDMEFYKIKTRRSGIELFELLSDPSNPVLSYIINYWWLLLLLLAMVFAIYRLYPKGPENYPGTSLKRFIPTFLFFSSFLFMGARGSFSVKPLRSFDAASFVDPRWVAACINSPTQLITSYSTRTPKAIDWMSEQKALSLFQPVQTVEHAVKGKPNVVLIILESFGRDYCGYLNKEKRFTPFLDSLAGLSLIYPNAYSSGTTSMESIPAIFASIPSLLEVPYINSTFQSNQVNGIHHYLSDLGYDCSFYYGARNGSMGFDNFLKISGHIQYFGMNEYPNAEKDFDGHWGIWDEEYLQYYAQELTRKKGPFFSSVFTLTSHDPYHIPDRYKEMFTASELPIHKSVQYTDYALRKFFETVWKSKLKNNTIFIITADHPSHSKNEYFYTPTGKYEIPLLIYGPKYFKPGINDSITASHTDILPTILSLAGTKEPFFAFGRTLLNSEYRTAINYDNGLIQLIDYPYCIRRYPDGSVKMHVQAKYTPNALIRYTLTPEEIVLRNRLNLELQAKYQLYINGLLNNAFNAVRK